MELTKMLKMVGLTDTLHKIEKYNAATLNADQMQYYLEFIVGDIIEIPRGHANFLIRSDQAVIAAVDNIKELENKNQEAKKDAEILENQMRELKDEIEAKHVYVNVKVGKEGKLFGAVTMKMVVEEYSKQHKIVLDKRKIIFDGNIDNVGTYEIPIQLHKDIRANLIVHVVEKE